VKNTAVLKHIDDFAFVDWSGRRETPAGKASAESENQQLILNKAKNKKGLLI
jgi:hypothetical protein